MLPIKLLYGKYSEEMQRNAAAFPMTEKEFESWVDKEAEKYQSIRNGNDGILLYSATQREDVIYCQIPVFGYYAVDEKTMSMMFESLAGKLVKDKKVEFTFSLYAHDEVFIRLFSMLQFGIISEVAIRRVEEDAFEDKGIHELIKQEIADRWTEVWSLTDAIVQHLKQSPVFYPGIEFTEELYRGFFLDKDTKVFGAFADDGTMIGIIESNAEQNELAFGKVKSVNIGEAYVLPEYRGCGLAKKLLLFAEAHSACSCSWVEHGTANPNARGFWGKYFTTYQYTMIREIKSINA